MRLSETPEAVAFLEQFLEEDRLLVCHLLDRLRLVSTDAFVAGLFAHLENRLEKLPKPIAAFCVREPDSQPFFPNQVRKPRAEDRTYKTGWKRGAGRSCPSESRKSPPGGVLQPPVHSDDAVEKGENGVVRR